MVKRDTSFDSSSLQYRCCCCGLFHITTAAFIVGIWGIASSCFYVGLFLIRGEKTLLNIVITSVENLGYLVVIILLFCGIFRKTHWLLLPYIIFMVLSCILTIFTTTYSVYLLFTMDSNQQKTFVKVHGPNIPPKDADSYFVLSIVAVCFINIGWLILQGWLISIVYRCYGYLRESAKPTEDPLLIEEGSNSTSLDRL